MGKGKYFQQMVLKLTHHMQKKKKKNQLLPHTLFKNKNKKTPQDGRDNGAKKKNLKKHFP